MEKLVLGLVSLVLFTGNASAISLEHKIMNQLSNFISNKQPVSKQSDIPKGSGTNFTDCSQFFYKGVAPVITNESFKKEGQLRELCFDDFAVLHSGLTKTPVLVMERLNKATIADAKGERRTDKFYEEARLPSSHRALLSDYAGSGKDRGHL
jgi:endonuclease G